MSKSINVALFGNPNTGKTSIFNALTGLSQKVGNYPGITVEKKEGISKLDRINIGYILDLPGTYSLNASSMDESVVVNLLLNKKNKDYPDVAVLIADVENLKRNLLLYTQLKDLGIPTLLVINMSDLMSQKGISLNIPLLEKKLETKIALVSTRKNVGLDELKKLIINYRQLPTQPLISLKSINQTYFNNLEKTFPDQPLYKLWLVITQDNNYTKVERNNISNTSGFKTESPSSLKKLQQKETIKRYQYINGILKQGLKIDHKNAKDFRSRLDRIFIHSFWGYVIFFAIYNFPINFISNFYCKLRLT